MGRGLGLTASYISDRRFFCVAGGWLALTSYQFAKMLAVGLRLLALSFGLLAVAAATSMNVCVFLVYYCCDVLVALQQTARCFKLLVYQSHILANNISLQSVVFAMTFASLQSTGAIPRQGYSAP